MANIFQTEVHVNGVFFKGAIQYVPATADVITGGVTVPGVPAHYKLFLNASKAVAVRQIEIEAMQDELLSITNQIAELNNELPPIV